MLNDEVKKQIGGDSSTNLQAQSIIVQQGITYRDAKEIALDVYKDNFYKLSEEASRVAIKRAEELTDNFLDKLKKDKSSSVESMNDPGMQVALFSAQKEYAKTGDEDLQNLLVDILVERSKSKVRDIKQIVLDESLEIAPRLTVEQFDVLTISWLLTKTKHNGLHNLIEFQRFINQTILQFVESLTTSSSCYEHLQYLGCGSIIQLGGWGKIEAKFRDTYPGLFCKGVSKDVIDAELPEDAKSMIIPCLHEASLFQVSAMNNETIETESKKKEIDPESVSKLKSVFEQSRMNEDEVKKYLLDNFPKIEILFKVWDDTPLQRLTLTTVGYAIAQANLRRKTGQEVDLSIWVK